MSTQSFIVQIHLNCGGWFQSEKLCVDVLWPWLSVELKMEDEHLLQPLKLKCYSQFLTGRHNLVLGFGRTLFSFGLVGWCTRWSVCVCVRASWELCLPRVLHTDATEQRKHKGKGRNNVKWIIIAFLLWIWPVWLVGTAPRFGQSRLSANSANLVVGGEMLASVIVIQDQKVGIE